MKYLFDRISKIVSAVEMRSAELKIMISYRVEHGYEKNWTLALNNNCLIFAT